jgi:hypothetical protein
MQVLCTDSLNSPGGEMLQEARRTDNDEYFLSNLRSYHCLMAGQTLLNRSIKHSLLAWSMFHPL